MIENFWDIINIKLHFVKVLVSEILQEFCILLKDI